MQTPQRLPTMLRPSPIKALTDGTEAAFEREKDTGGKSQVAEIPEDYIPSGGGLTERLALHNHPVPPGLLALEALG